MKYWLKVVCYSQKSDNRAISPHTKKLANLYIFYFMGQNNHFNVFQSGFRSNQSMEPALIKVENDIYVAHLEIQSWF